MLYFATEAKVSNRKKQTLGLSLNACFLTSTFEKKADIGAESKPLSANDLATKRIRPRL